jgi:hypothetical protein
MTKHEYTHPELKLTAILYAHNPQVVAYLKKNGKLPDVIHDAGFATGLRITIETRGRDPELSEDEYLVYEAILRENRLPGGGARFVNNQDPDQT